MDLGEIDNRYTKTLDKNRNLRQAIVLLKYQQRLLFRRISASMEALGLQGCCKVLQRIGPQAEHPKPDQAVVTSPPPRWA